MADPDKDGTDLLAALAGLPPVWLQRVVRRLGLAELRELEARWYLRGHKGQMSPGGDWAVWLIRAGRGFGKTRAGAEWVSCMAREDPGARIALVGGSADDVRQVMIEGPSGLLAVARQGEKLRWRSTLGELVFLSGARASVYSAEAPERLRGPQHGYAWCDELAKWRGDAGKLAWDNLRMGMREGDRPRIVVTTTPKTVALMHQVRATADCHETIGRTHDNPHLPASFVEAMVAEYAGTLKGRQELDGEMIEDLEGALWSRAMIERQRVRDVPELVRVVVGVDPPAGSARPEGGDACGIVAVGLGRDGKGYVLEDASVRGASPEGWARAVAGCAARWNAERVIAEKNQGGSMVESVLRAAEAGLPIRLVHASRGKSARAEPVAALYEGAKVWHAGAFPELEDELCGLQAGGGYAGPGRSPDRADALVWALTELMLRTKRAARITGL
ncbi:MAG: ATP-binding protein [Sphingomonadales bacterium]|nr:MAG: ATP-binding protein [Sphingomonadales bacterium]